MTGQVKEDKIARWKEFRIEVLEGCLRFNPSNFVVSMIQKGPNQYSWYTLEGEKNSIEVEENSMFFTYCQIPVIYTPNK